jgi:hypothetical protein
MSKITLSEFWGDGEYSNRKSSVCKDDNGFLVEFYENDVLLEPRHLYEHSEIYAENAAENWVIGVIREIGSN